METPFKHKVPTEITANLKYRAKLHRRVIEEPAYSHALWDACALDPLFYISAFGYTYDPRCQPFAKLPFILYPFQEGALLQILEAIGSHDLFIEKSRDMGASWLSVLAFEWMWHFRNLQSFLMVSRTENYVDNAENPKSLFWKIDFFHENLPLWLMPPGYKRSDHRRKLHIKNPDNGSVIDGEATTGQVARGDRRTAILLDEFAAVEQGQHVLASTRDATRSRIFNSTPLGIANAYYDVGQTKIKKLSLHWREHPLKSRGLYETDKKGKLRILRKEGYLGDYHPILDGTLRSPEYDLQESRSSPREMAQEWNIDYLGSGHQFFQPESIQQAIRKYAKSPVVIGDLEYDSLTGEVIRFREDPNGRLKLWCLLDKDGNIRKEHRAVLGVDVSAGTGASNSCLAGYDATTSEKILEYANPYIRPEEFAKQAVAIARWMGGAYLLWEQQGPGRQFGPRVVELGYANIYLRKREEAISKKVSNIPGWASTKEGKLQLLGNYRSAIEKETCINRSREALEECLEYIFNPQGGASHARASNKDDPSGANTNHGDRVIADALAWHGLSERKSIPKPEKPEIPVGSLAWRRQQRKQEEQKPNRRFQGIRRRRKT